MSSDGQGTRGGPTWDEPAKADSTLERLAEVVGNYPSARDVHRAVDSIEALRSRNSAMWAVLAGSPEDSRNSGLVSQIQHIVTQLDKIEERVRGNERAIQGDGNGRRGFTMRVHDLEGSVQRLENWGKYIGGIVTLEFLGMLSYLVKWWAGSVGG